MVTPVITPDANVLDVLPVEQAALVIDQPVITPEPTPEQAAPPVAGESASPSPQEELATLRRQLAQAKSARDAEITEATLQREAQKVYDEELAAGLSTEDALRIAKRHYSTSQQAMAQQKVERDKQAAAELVGQRYKVSPALLMSGTSGEHMETIAQLFIVNKRIEALEKGQVSVQAVNSNNSRAGNVAVTADNIDQLFMDFENESMRIGQPNRQNPYEPALRKMMVR